ncbi:hypothetical protein AMTRI_Chr02g257210 [Amborella trichopoda]
MRLFIMEANTNLYPWCFCGHFPREGFLLSRGKLGFWEKISLWEFNRWSGLGLILRIKTSCGRVHVRISLFFSFIGYVHQFHLSWKRGTSLSFNSVIYSGRVLVPCMASFWLWLKF